MRIFQPNEVFDGRYKLVELIGRGGFAEVWKVQRDSGFIQAVKIFTNLDASGVNLAREEFEKVFNLRHDRLLTATDYGIFEGHPYLVMAYCQHGTAMKKVGNIEESELAKLIFDISSGLSFLHELENFILHQDIKPDNFLIDNRGNYLLADFGISKQLKRTMIKSINSARRTQRMLDDQKNTGVAPPAYRPPEVFDTNYANRKLVKASDIWAFGASIYELATAELPFGEFGGLVQRQGAEVPDLPTGKFSTGLEKLIKWCLHRDPNKRPTAGQLKMVAEDYLRVGAWNVPKPGTPEATVMTQTTPFYRAPTPVGTADDPSIATVVSQPESDNKMRKIVFGILGLIGLATVSFFMLPRHTPNKFLGDRGNLPVTDSTVINSPSVVTPDPVIPSKPVVKPDPVIPSKPAVKPDPVIPSKPAVKPDPVVPSKPVVKPDPVIPSKPIVKPDPVIPSKPAVKPNPVVPPKPAVKPKSAKWTFTKKDANSFVRKNYQLKVSPQTTISTRDNLQKGDSYNFIIKEDLKLGKDNIVIRKGTVLSGKLVKKNLPNENKRGASLKIQFKALALADNNSVECSYLSLEKTEKDRATHIEFSPKNTYAITLSPRQESKFKNHLLAQGN